MNKRVFTIMIALLLAAFVPKAYGQGTGTADDPIEISDAAGLVSINTAMHYKLTTDITLEGNWTPIRSKFTGTLDGCGFTISGLSVNNTGTGKSGLFSTIGEGGTVKNLGVIGTVTGKNYAGSIAGTNAGTIQNCYTSVAVTSTGITTTYGAGGIAGSNYGTIQNCYTTGAVTNQSGVAGGIAGLNSIIGGATIQYCYATGAISGNQAGGITGSLDIGGEILNCIALNASITGTDRKPSVGRITGIKGESGDWKNNYAALSITGAWADKGADKKDGADLTTDFTSAGAGTGAFAGWEATNWTFGNNTNLPQVNTTTGTSIGGQTAYPRADYLVAPVTIITTKEQLADIAKNLSGSYELGNDINLTGVSWTPLGYNNEKPFTGTFDGGGYVISHLTVNLTDGTTTLYAGLFGIIGAGGTVKNLGIQGGSVSATSSAYEYAGGIAGENRGIISNCYTNLPVGKANGGDLYAGGIAGRNRGDGLIENCYALGDVVASEYAGGIAGSNYGSNETIQYCYATGSVTGKFAGGITCKMSTVKNCIALNAGITTTDTSGDSSNGMTYRVSNATTKSGNHATACLISNSQGANEVAGENLTALNFTNVKDASEAFAEWSAWDVSTDNLPTLKGFNAAQPATTTTRTSVMPLTTIANADDLLTFHDITGNHYIYEGETVTLTASFDFAPQQWLGISNNEAFKGTFDGGGNAINRKGDYISLFEKIDNGGTVKNLAVTGDPISFEDHLGGIAYINNGTIENCYTTLSLNAKTRNDDAGGIAVNNNGTIRNCYTTGAITAGRNAGGIAANNAGGTIEKCYATGAIKGAMAGGMAGSSTGTIKNCIALNSSITGTGATTGIGRITGTLEGTLTDNTAALSIAGTWADKGTGAKNGEDLRAETFTGASSVASGGVFNAWADNWTFDSANTLLPTLNGFTAAQPVATVERAPFLAETVILIKTQAELAAITNLSASYALTNNITFSDDWKPIGDYSNQFTGTLDGQGFTISGLKVSITNSSSIYAGLFGYIGGGTVKNLSVTGSVTVTATNNTANVGGIAGRSEDGTITNCYTHVEVNATGGTVYAGGIVGYMANATAITSNCFATGNCTTTATASSATSGGIVGYNAGSLSYCYATGTVESKGGTRYTGGIAGRNTASGTLTGCIALNKDGITGAAEASYTNRVVGNNANSKGITHCYASPLIPGTWSNIGATAQSGADLTVANFIDSSAFAEGWADNWTFGDNTNLPTLMTTGLTPNKEVGVQRLRKNTK